MVANARCLDRSVALRRGIDTLQSGESLIVL